jgi:hypothetical protein
MDAKLKKYPKTKRFRVIDTIGVPHSYCIGTRHVAHASDNFGGMLSADAIRDGDTKGIYCDICRTLQRETGAKILSYDEHKQALLVECGDENKKMLGNYLKRIAKQAEHDGYEGFAFIKK